VKARDGIEARLKELVESRAKWLENLEKSRANLAAHNGAIEQLEWILAEDAPVAPPPTEDA